MENAKLKNDIILVVSLLAVAVIILAVFLAFAKNGKTVLVILDGKEQVCYDIDKDLTIDIASENNNINTLVIKDGKASITGASCPDKICVNHRSIKRVGETIVCLPNKVVIKIVKEKD